ncbi:MAG: hypothetical protein LH647_09490 [Leptolyngbyaceae cyanobacterium CAN_BIN12]|nr:hypothetical protein [Leptolyngbyaceae cyanobacterium CAN_BIN12]
MFQILKPLVDAIQPFLVPLCFVSAWLFVLLVTWNLWMAVRDTVVQTQKMHQIPCSNCRFFTSNYQLKCTVHPSNALTEEAINCPDFDPPR